MKAIVSFESEVVVCLESAEVMVIVLLEHEEVVLGSVLYDLYEVI